MARERDGAIQTIDRAPYARFYARTDLIYRQNFMKSLAKSGLQKEEIIRFAEHLIKSENDLAVLGNLSAISSYGVAIIVDESFSRDLLRVSD